MTSHRLVSNNNPLLLCWLTFVCWFVFSNISAGAAAISRGLCKPVNGMKQNKCRSLIEQCHMVHNIKMKWCETGPKAKRGEAGCQCDQYCGFKTKSSCSKDKQCIWKLVKKKGACYNRLTGKKGTAMKGICPVSATSGPSTAPVTSAPSKAPSAAPVTSAPSKSPSAVPTGSPSIPPLRAVYVATGIDFNCAITTENGVKCWGDGGFGRLGNSHTLSSSLPVHVEGLNSGVTSLCASVWSACVVHNGGAKCWGYGGNGQLGNNGTTDSNVPVNVTGLDSGVQEVACGGYHVCALLESGTVKCWGLNNYGQLGDGTYSNKLSPVDVKDLTGVTRIFAGIYHSCAVKDLNELWCWGSNFAGELGLGPSHLNQDFNVPQHAVYDFGSTITNGDIGEHIICIVNSTESGYCMGYNADGRLGDGTQTNRVEPVQIAIINSEIVSISSAYSASCAALRNGSAYCWGSAISLGRLGDGTTGQSNFPVKVAGEENHQQISVSPTNVCSIRLNNEVWCWGKNVYGSVGNGISGGPPVTTPERVS